MTECLHRKLRVALIVDSNISSKYVYDLAVWGKKQTNLEVSLLIMQKTSFSSLSKFKRGIESLKNKGAGVLLEQIGYLFLVKFDRLLLRRNATHKDHFKLCNLNEVITEIINVEPVLSKSGFVYRYCDKDIKKIKQQDIDVLIRCGSGILRGDILTVAKYGIISFHHADNEVNRGGPLDFGRYLIEKIQPGLPYSSLPMSLMGATFYFEVI